LAANLSICNKITFCLRLHTARISLAALADDNLLETAFAWLCQQRKKWPAAADVWDLRARWPEAKAQLQAELRAEQFRFGVLCGPLVGPRCAGVEGVGLGVGGRLPFSRRCVHVKGHGGTKAAVRQVLAQLPQHRFVLKTDVKSYYASIDHVRLQEQLSKHIPDKGVLRGYCGNTGAGVPSAGDCSTTSSAEFRSAVRSAP
jgi:RNA-directed DNA polymerase